jgi:hypothetical protein
MTTTRLQGFNQNTAQPQACAEDAAAEDASAAPPKTHPGKLIVDATNESKGLDMKGDSEKILSIGGGALRAWCAMVACMTIT